LACLRHRQQNRWILDIFLSGFQPDLRAVQAESLKMDFLKLPFNLPFPSTDNFIRFLLSQFPSKKKLRRKPPSIFFR
jgi:hypothetical protein